MDSLTHQSSDYFKITMFRPLVAWLENLSHLKKPNANAETKF